MVGSNFYISRLTKSMGSIGLEITHALSIRNHFRSNIHTFTIFLKHYLGNFGRQKVLDSRKSKVILGLENKFLLRTHFYKASNDNAYNVYVVIECRG